MPDFLSPSEYFHSKNFRPRKYFGQHFLAQPATANRIVQSADLGYSDLVIEIGPGLGALTRFVLPLVETLHLVEVDRELAEYLEERIQDEKKAIVYRQDILDFDFVDLSRNSKGRLIVLGNLPYNISSLLLFRLLESFPSIERAVFMVQKEVGMRFAAAPGSKEYGVLSVLLGIYSKVRMLFTVGPGQFYPPPKVDSVVIRIDFAGEHPAGPDFDFLRKFVSKAFQKRRKTVVNSLAGICGLSSDALKHACEQADIDARRRPEAVTPEEFLVLAGIVHRFARHNNAS